MNILRNWIKSIILETLTNAPFVKITLEIQSEKDKLNLIIKNQSFLHSISWNEINKNPNEFGEKK